MSPVTLCNVVDGNVWWSRYQPLSYEIGSSAVGSYDEIKQFIKKCNDRKIKVICDVVINHMANFKLDITQDSTYDVYGLKKAKERFKQNAEFDKVHGKVYSKDGFSYAWSGSDFNRYGNVTDKFHGYDITNWDDPRNYRTRWLVGLPDLSDFSENVKLNRRVFMSELAILGFAGIRVDAVKHVQPSAIFDMVNQFINSATGPEYTAIRNLPSFKPSEVFIICESLSNGRDYDDTFKIYMSEFAKTKVPSSNFLFYDNMNHFSIKDQFNNLRADTFEVSRSMLNKNLGQNALNYLCNHDERGRRLTSPRFATQTCGDVARNSWATPDYFCNGFVNTLFYGLMYLVHRMNVMVFNDDAFAYTRDLGFDQSVANKRLKSDNFTKEYDNKVLGEIIKFSKVLDGVANLSVERFKYGPNLVYKFNDLGLFIFSFTGCAFDAKAISSMNLGGFVDYTDAFSKQKMSDCKLQPSCSALFIRNSTSTPISNNGPTDKGTEGTISTSYNFQLDLEIKISGTNPQVLVKSANFVK